MAVIIFGNGGMAPVESRRGHNEPLQPAAGCEGQHGEGWKNRAVLAFHLFLPF